MYIKMDQEIRSIDPYSKIKGCTVVEGRVNDFD